jgi:hypothetical protein
MASLRLESALAAACMFGIVAAMAGAAGCDGEGDVSGARSCSLDRDCPDQNYCDAKGQCAKDCDPTAAQNTCASGQSCDPRGRCVDSAISCGTNDDCDGVAPSAPECDGTTSVIRNAVGRCLDQGMGPQCAYEDQRTPCLTGCNPESGVCNPDIDPCEGKTCDMPPATKCDNNTLVTYNASGMCSMTNGTCSYASQRMDCVAGCANNACKTGTCDGVTCDTAPAARCADDDPNLLITYDAAGMCEDNMGQPRCNYPSTLTNCAYAGGTCTAGACAGTKTQVGPLIVTEYMASPATPLNDFAHEWFEVTNTSADAVDLNGWILRSAGAGETFTVATSVMVAPGSSVVLGNGADPQGDGTAAPAINYGATLKLTGEDSIELVDPQGMTSDFVYWEGGAIMTGRSRKLSPAAMQTAEGNDSFASWCPSLADAFGPEGKNFGTPGAANTACAADPCATLGCTGKPADFCNAMGDAVKYTDAAPTCENTRFNNPFCDYKPMTTTCDKAATSCVAGTCEPFPTNLPMPGQVIITELMGNPDVVTDDKGDWLELYNTTDQELALFSLKIEDNETGGSYTSFTINNPALKIPAKSYLVFASSADPAVNGGIQNAVAMTTGLLKNSPTIDQATGKSTMRIRLVRPDMTVVDEAYYGAPATGASQQLSLPAYDGVADPAASNDADTSFCVGLTGYNGADKGTPGAANYDCANP